MVLCITNFQEASRKSGKGICNDLPSLKGKKVLMVSSGLKGHLPVKITAKVKAYLDQEGAVVTVSDSLGVYTNKKILGENDFILPVWTMCKIKGPQEKGLLEAVKYKAGFAGKIGWLGDSFGENTEYQLMIGGHWFAHLGEVIDCSVQVTNKKAPLNQGVKRFNIKPEQYIMHVVPDVKVLAITNYTDKYLPNEERMSPVYPNN